METCVRCGISGEEVRLFDAIYDGRMEKICERCSIIENIPVIKKPDASQLRDAEQVTVFKRMKRLAGVSEEKKDETFFVEDKLRELDTKPELEMPEKNKLNLIEHYHWEIMKNRRRKGLSQEKLAENLGESVTAIQMIEKGKLPENAESLIRKLEQFFLIKLRKVSETEKIMQEIEKEEKPVLLDESGRKLEEIPEPEVKIEEPEIIEGGIGETEKKKKEPTEIDLRGIDKEKGEMDIHKVNLEEIKIGDLKELHRKRIEATKEEQEEEKRKIEERQKLIEARKEELRLLREKESKDLDRYLGGSELLKKVENEEKESQEKKEEKGTEIIEDFEKELI